MIDVPSLVFLCGLLVFGAGVQLGVWHILAGPDRPNYPTSGAWKRRIMFLLMASMLYRGLEVMFASPEATTADFGMVCGSMMTFAFFNIMLIDHLRNWLPAKTHARIRQLLHVASCKPGRGLVAARESASGPSTKPVPSAAVVAPALVELSLQGFRVAGPGAGPEALN